MYWQSILAGGMWLRWVALAIFIAAGITDILDGYFARSLGQQSSFGRMLDPIADKLLVASCLLMLAADETIKGWSLWAAIVILCREILVSGLREYLAELRVSVPVTRLAKWKTTVATRRHRLPARRQGRRRGHRRDHRHEVSPVVTYRPDPAVDFGHRDALHRL